MILPDNEVNQPMDNRHDFVFSPFDSKGLIRYRVKSMSGALDPPAWRRDTAYDFNSLES